MKASWGLVAVLWGIIFSVIVVCLVSEKKKTPEQRAAEIDAAKERRKADQRRLQEQINQRPARGCLQNMAILFVLSRLVLISILVLIIVVARS